jgi:uncharacterized protein (DUF1810 family)
MTKEKNASGGNDPFNLTRFVDAQKGVYEGILTELRNGRKRTHWMWYIFPQVEGLGHSPTARYYAIRSLKEAGEYLRHPVLGMRLIECAEAVLGVEGRSVSEIFGYPDDMKLKSSMTLFAAVPDADSVFVRILEKYFNGQRDERTLRILEEMGVK